MLNQQQAWARLQAHASEVKSLHLRDVFAANPQRFEQMSLAVDALFLDYSKQRVLPETLTLLSDLADAVNLRAAIDAMFAGEKINTSEQRAALHVALRHRGSRAFCVDGENVMPAVRAVLAQMRDFSERVRSGVWRGHTGQTITDVVNIGIGGSDLGPAMVCEALRAYGHPGLRMHFVSNVDGSQLWETLQGLDPATTLFIVASKTFTTQETLTNARSARAWFLDRVGDEAAIAQHFVAVSTNRDEVVRFGIDPNNMFAFWDWVGGRYSLWSAIGLAIAVYIGMDGFEAMQEGAYLMDEHFRSAPWTENMPVLLGLLGVWAINGMGWTSHVVAPYDQYLHRLPAYLQQLDMESNGKSVQKNGEPVAWATGPGIWGEPGTNSQHAYFQLLHQGTNIIPVDFILARRPLRPLGNHHQLLQANCLAQSQALMLGKTAAEVATEMQAQGLAQEQVNALLSHRVFAGNRPSNTLVIDQLSPRTLGLLLALYEHKIFVQGVVWGINSFDQWGVELGKQLAGKIVQHWQQPEHLADSSTQGLLKRLHGK